MRSATSASVAADHDVVVGRAGDRAEVGARVCAVPAEDRALVFEALRTAVEVRVLRVLRRDLQRHLLAAAGDPERDAAGLQRERAADRAVDLVVLAVEGRGAGGPGLAHDLDALVEPPEPLAGAGEAVAVGPPLVLVPAAADAHLDAAARDDVDGGGDLGEVGRVAVAHAGAHLAEAHPLGGGGEGGHQRPRLVGRLLGGHRHGVEVVVDPDRLPRPGIGVLGEGVHRAPLLGRIDADEVMTPALGNEESEAHAAKLTKRDGAISLPR